MIRACAICECKYDDTKKTIGKIIHCEDCSEEHVIALTGNMVYDDKTGASIQINADPALTQMINHVTANNKKAANLGSALKTMSKYSAHSVGSVYKVADVKNPKHKSF